MNTVLKTIDTLFNYAFAWKVLKSSLVYVLAAWLISAITSYSVFNGLVIVSAVLLLHYTIKAIRLKEGLDLRESYFRLVENFEIMEQNLKEYEEVNNNAIEMYQVLEAKSQTLKENYGTIQQENQSRAERLHFLSGDNESLKNTVQSLELEKQTIEERASKFYKHNQTLSEEVERLKKYEERYRSAAGKVSALQGKLNKLEG